jgi:hypothetical protein
MKKIIFTLLFSTLVFSSPSYADWTKVSRTVSGNNYYVDFDRIRKYDGYVYFWELDDYLKPLSGKYLSFKGYMQGDCKLFRHKELSSFYYTDSMGNGTPFIPAAITLPWVYPPPSSVTESILNSVCSH